MTDTILLHNSAGVKREVGIVSISRWKNARNQILPNIEIFWPIAGTYLLDLWHNQLLGAPSWGAVDHEAAWVLWIDKCPGRWRELKSIVPDQFRRNAIIIQAATKRSGEKAQTVFGNR